MIEKLKEHDVVDPKTGKVIGKIGCDLREIMDKLNELVDTVNELTSYVGPLGVEFIEPKPVEFTEPNLADPYAKYRKWAGKLCRFWNEDKDRAIYDILEEVIADWSYQFKTKRDYIFDHCEPVKPDDPIIYKGEKCETPAENVQPDYVTTTYPTDGHTKKYYGQNGTSIVTDHPLPAGYIITINEPELKGGDNDSPAN